MHLKPGHVQPVWAGHPWIYAQAVHRMDGGATAGDEVSVLDPRGNLLGRGFYSPGSSIPVRLLVRDAETPLDAAFFREKLERALTWRVRLGLPTAPSPDSAHENEKTTGYRLVHAEGDGLPGLIVDRFDDVLAVQFLTSGMKKRESVVLAALEQLLSPRAIVDRTPPATAKQEGFTAGSGVVRGAEEAEFSFHERGLAFRIPFELGQKTGYYFDQRGLRARVERLARGRRVLDAYSFVGPFALAAARGGATEVTSVDDSALALQVAAECARANHLDSKVTFVKADARKALRDAGASGGHDLVIVDPPRLAPTRGSREGALVAYAKLAELGCRATKPGGDLVLCSCSSAVDLSSLTRALAIGALHANVQAFIWERAFQGADHPVSAAFPEGLYLKALIARIEKR
ncbi:class I SAM-dependent rRNA methyltransferase [Pendulispora albinea]|uniref:Class I SAM-dependent rRNA methyltransferase n=1 Tax=Pendulispora albinea TaxID=2741071 RepID=A0ABZ2LTY8_9BACT